MTDKIRERISGQNDKAGDAYQFGGAKPGTAERTENVVYVPKEKPTDPDED